MRTLTQSVVPDPGRRRPGDRPSTAKEPALTVADEEVRVGVLVRTIEHEIIPRLMLAHRAEAACMALPEIGGSIRASDVESFVKLVLSPDENLAALCVEAMRTQGQSAEAICLGLLAPVARRLGELWEQDLCDFTEVTFGLGRLHQILRGLSGGFDRPQDAPANGHRILLMPAPGEQHTFGLMMVAEFFRHDGWEVEVVLEEDMDPVLAMAGEWFDVIGFTAGAFAKTEPLRDSISRVRRAAPNPRVCIMVGGPLFLRDPGLAKQLGADGVATDGRAAPAAAARLVASHAGNSRQ